MRVTFNTFPNGLIDQLSRLNTQQNGFQAETATGQRITNAEDDPASVRRVLDMQGETKTLDQYQRNISRHQELASASFAAIKQSKSLVDRAAEIATLADGTKSPETLKTLGIEVDSLLAQAVSDAWMRRGSPATVALTLMEVASVPVKRFSPVEPVRLKPAEWMALTRLISVEAIWSRLPRTEARSVSRESMLPRMVPPPASSGVWDVVVRSSSLPPPESKVSSVSERTAPLISVWPSTLI
jgi:hypothetical protein